MLPRVKGLAFSLLDIVDADVALYDFRNYSVGRLVPPAESGPQTGKHKGHRRQFKSGHYQMPCPTTDGVDHKPCYLAEGDEPKKAVDFILVLGWSSSTGSGRCPLETR